MSYQLAGPGRAVDAPSSFGLAANVAALIAYLFVPLTSIVLLATEKENRLVRFHAWQSCFFGLAVTTLSIALSVVFFVVSFVLSAASPALGFLVTIAMLLVWLVLAVVIVAVWALCLVKAYRGELYELPLIGGFAAKLSGK